MCELDVEDVQSWVNSTGEQCYNCGSDSLTVEGVWYDTFLVDPSSGVSPYRIELSCNDCSDSTKINLRWNSVAEIDSSVVVAGVI